MKLGKITRVILISGLIGTLGVFTASTYDLMEAKSFKTEFVNTFLVSNIFQKEMKNFKDGNKLKSIQAEVSEGNNSAKVASNTSVGVNKNNTELSRGGSGLNTTRPLPKLQSKAIQKSKNLNDTTNGTSVPGKVDQVDLFSRLVSAEAGGESFEGQLAVATVIMNRVNSPEFPGTISGVIFDNNWGYQFTPVLDGRINLPASASAKRAVSQVLSGYRSFGSDVTYFINPKKAVSTWIINHKTFFKTVGNHDFYH